MCILILIPTKAQKPGEDILERCWRSNPDGAGLMYPDVTRELLIVDKGHMTLDAIKAAFAKIPEGVPVALHFRIATHGGKGADMTHPHVVWPDEVAIAHNGILPIGAPADSKESDTARFARLVLPALPKTWWKNAALVHLVEEYMGRANKMVVMNRHGSFKILNETQGQWEGGVWYSNATFRTARSYGGFSRWDEGPDYGYGGWSNDRTPTAGTHTVSVGAGSVQTGSQACAQVAQSGTPVIVDADRAEDERILGIFTDTPVDPATDTETHLRGGLTNGDLEPADIEIMCKDIGNMTDAEWTQYQAIMECMP